jgi:tRNA modification GTPase
VPLAYESDTIAAIATPEGEGGISVIRISGDGALENAGRGFRGSTTVDKMSSHTAHYGRFVDEHGSTIDDIVLLVFKRPNSYTGEDTVELSCHGGRYVTRKILETTLRFGARAAQAGEFTKRAFLNGRIDLAQAEAVADLIHSRTERAHQASLAQLNGVLSKQISALRELLIESVGLLELELDFAEDGYEFTDKSKVIDQLTQAISQINALLSSYMVGRIYRDGVKVALLGAPNVGKSSLLNALLQEDRAIVNETPGTTRDVIEESISLGGLVFDISDTAGIRHTTDPVEKEGVRRAQERLLNCDILLFVIDGARQTGDKELESIRRLTHHIGDSLAARILVVNKIDIPESRLFNTMYAEEALGTKDVVRISAKTREGLDSLKNFVLEKALRGSAQRQDAGVVITSARHYSALERSSKSLTLALETIRSGSSGEFVAVDIRTALDSLGEIVGSTSTEDILNSVFSRFCIGK